MIFTAHGMPQIFIQVNILIYTDFATRVTNFVSGPYIEPHTNLTEISDATDLLWRAGVTPGKVVLGQGWYGRSFTLSDPR
jgi:GH18 family chitinase